MYQCYKCGATPEKYTATCVSCKETLTIVDVQFPIPIAKIGTSAKEIAQKKHDYYQIPGFEFLGELVKNERIWTTVYGKPGSGKSYFLLALADQLSRKDNKTLYVAAEEGKNSATIRKKLKDLKIENEYLFIEERMTVPQIISKIKEINARNLFIDSVSSMKLKPHEGRDLCNKVRGFAGFLLHSTKDGTYKGSTEWIHDCDIEIFVRKGVAYTGNIGKVACKNRYGGSGKYRIFGNMPPMPKAKAGGMNVKASFAQQSAR